MDEPKQITPEECREICDRLMERLPGVGDTVFLWTEAWLDLGHSLGYEDLMLPAPDPNVPGTPENEIATIQREMYELLERRSSNPRACMKAFEKIDERRP